MTDAETIDDTRAQLLRLAGLVASNLDRLAAATTDDERRRATRGLRTATGMLDACVIELAAMIAGADTEASVVLRRAMGRAMRSIVSETRSEQSRLNGAAPVRDGSRPRGRPRKDKGPE